ncbi:putative transposase [Parabacteroides sp. PFB2-10]|uniref:IS200/IS605 family transposase n=1 Tax=Parabacteroides sp. PFB2-10 TaxID=1742405 RepID=UPI0024756925|nr:IS200/IS605 family transposase [Parabacteroides sp. PFB2-10]MDH6314058.1 putative transposase [Parabacteroides sp. PFB2-10]
MPFIKIMLHCVWSTKNREPFLSDKTIRHELFKHILANAREKGIFIDHIGGEKEHVHCLISLGCEQNISKIIQLIKGESSHWFNKIFGQRLEWQDDYFVVSVSESQLSKVRAYILNQEEHHKRKNFNDESEEFINKHNFMRNK